MDDSYWYLAPFAFCKNEHFDHDKGFGFPLPFDNLPLINPHDYDKSSIEIDKGEINKASQLLLSTPFQKVHQSYTRTEMWQQICEKLGEPCNPVPSSLGEDRLARFGAYREFE